MLPPLGFNEAPTYTRSTAVSPSLAHLLKVCVYKDMPEDAHMFYSVKTLEDWRKDYKTEHAPLVDEQVWQYHDTCAALFDEWFERDDLHIVLQDSLQNEFTLLKNIADIRTMDSVRWAALLRETLYSQRWKNRDMGFYVVTADTVWM